MIEYRHRPFKRIHCVCQELTSWNSLLRPYGIKRHCFESSRPRLNRVPFEPRLRIHDHGRTARMPKPRRLKRRTLTELHIGFGLNSGAERPNPDSGPPAASYAANGRTDYLGAKAAHLLPVVQGCSTPETSKAMSEGVALSWDRGPGRCRSHILGDARSHLDGYSWIKPKGVVAPDHRICVRQGREVHRICGLDCIFHQHSCFHLGPAAFTCTIPPTGSWARPRSAASTTVRFWRAGPRPPTAYGALPFRGQVDHPERVCSPGTLADLQHRSQSPRGRNISRVRSGTCQERSSFRFGSRRPARSPSSPS